MLRRQVSYGEGDDGSIGVEDLDDLHVFMDDNDQSAMPLVHVTGVGSESRRNNARGALSDVKKMSSMNAVAASLSKSLQIASLLHESVSEPWCSSNQDLGILGGTKKDKSIMSNQPIKARLTYETKKVELMGILCDSIREVEDLMDRSKDGESGEVISFHKLKMFQKQKHQAVDTLSKAMKEIEEIRAVERSDLSEDTRDKKKGNTKRATTPTSKRRGSGYSDWSDVSSITSRASSFHPDQRPESNKDVYNLPLCLSPVKTTKTLGGSDTKLKCDLVSAFQESANFCLDAPDSPPKRPQRRGSHGKAPPTPPAEPPTTASPPATPTTAGTPVLRRIDSPVRSSQGSHGKTPPTPPAEPSSTASSPPATPTTAGRPFLSRLDSPVRCPTRTISDSSRGISVAESCRSATLSSDIESLGTLSTKKL